MRVAGPSQRWAAAPPFDVFQRGYVAGDPVDVDPLSNRAVDAVEPHLGLLAKPVNLALETARLVAFFQSCSLLVCAAESYAGTAQTVLPVGKARTLPRSSFSQSAYLVITSRRRSTAVILR